MEIVKEVVVKEEIRYVANDGKVFLSKAHCKEHEKDLARAVLKAKLSQIECCEEAEGYTPLDGCEYMEYEQYHWYRPKTREEATVLYKWYELEDELDEREIGQWICIEENDSCTWLHYMNSSIAHIKEFFAKFGCDVTITEKEDNNV